MATEAANAETAAIRKPTREEFIIDWPLFVKARLENFDPPQKISFYCKTPKTCERETTWERSYVPVNLKNALSDPEINSVEYRCHKCNVQRLTIIYRKMGYEKRTYQPAIATGLHGGPPSPPVETTTLVSVMKVGQYPQPTINIPKEVEKNLGKDDASLYKKALISRNNGFGLAAVMYMRRVVENKTNELIDVAAHLAKSHGIEEQIVSDMRSASDSSKYTTYEEKLRVASTVFPDQLKVGSINPLQTLYGLVSEAVHSKSEDECIGIADQTKYVFEYLFAKLRAQMDEQNEFVEKVKILAKPKGSRESSLVVDEPGNMTESSA